MIEYIVSDAQGARRRWHRTQDASGALEVVTTSTDKASDLRSMFLFLILFIPAFYKPMRPTNHPADDVHAPERWRRRATNNNNHEVPLLHKPEKAAAEDGLHLAPPSSTIWRRRFPESGWRSPKVRPRVSNQEQRVATLSLPRDGPTNALFDFKPLE
ncbi:hypothetical protein SDRG_00658 [Saprolegnia diclina VS20]|uniref:Uncharacterized protein n=1 Tax=Saprolegnia diclina (strain VS20) TaxID=1156394 RepID=T0R5U5_SAPDV|nr:hypothetical protein SDRG_00658 [Saprolegnia diclina VS20]EQC41795.1 hypothetical protein SDRG_00658 [Saprolegnia diclina VS20]|eukprot:XP_008604364.1 hypothetical protein SDRG_00658 [Saprolegnia diclina VS20]